MDWGFLPPPLQVQLKLLGRPKRLSLFFHFNYGPKTTFVGILQFSWGGKTWLFVWIVLPAIISSLSRFFYAIQRVDGSFLLPTLITANWRSVADVSEGMRWPFRVRAIVPEWANAFIPCCSMHKAALLLNQTISSSRACFRATAGFPGFQMADFHIAFQLELEGTGLRTSCVPEEMFSLENLQKWKWMGSP